MIQASEKYYDPPERTMRFIRWFCADSFLEEIEGDLYEYFQEEVADLGINRARRRFFFKAIRYAKPYFFDRRILSFHHYYHPDMLKHYFKISMRHLFRQRFYSLINIGGFAIGLACFLLILLYINHELSYDHHYIDGDQIYRVIHEGEGEGGAVVTTPLAETLLREYPEVIEAARVAPDLDEAGSNLIRVEGQAKNIYQDGFLYVDPSFLGLFKFPMIQGERNALQRPYTIILTASKAELLFPGENPLGRNIIFNDNLNQPFEVTGVMEDLPNNTHFQFDYLLSMEGVENAQVPNWGFGNFMTYVKLSPNTIVPELEQKMVRIIKEYKDPDYEEKVKAGDHYWFGLQAVKDIHLKSAHIYGYWTHGNIRYVWLFGIIAFFILLIASINFMNLSTARSANRAKEVGLRKVLGSYKKQLASQFLLESILVSFIAFIIAILLAWTLLPGFNNLTDRSLSIPWQNISLYPMVLGAIILIGFLSGLYPSLFLSSFRPIQSLQGAFQKGKKGTGLRSALVVIQFTISIILIIGSLVVKKQVNYIQNKQLGFDKEQILIIEDSYILNQQSDAFKEQVKNLKDIETVSMTSYVPVKGYERNGSGAWPTGTNPEETGVGLAKWYVDHDYVSTLGLKITEGRDFSIAKSTDREAVILNKKAVELLELEDPIGKQITSYTYLDSKTGKLLDATYTIIGVVEDFHFESFKQNIEGLSLVLGNWWASSTLVKMNTNNPQNLLADIEDVWAQFAPNQPFRYHFLDERYAKMYAFEQRIGQIFTAFTGLAIIIACLGLFALATFMAEQKRKEISIRKVLGASIGHLTFMLTKNFARLVVLALILAVPLAWWLMQKWLQDFAYRIHLGWSVFALAGISALAIAVLTVAYQAIRASIANPVDNLRGGN